MMTTKLLFITVSCCFIAMSHFSEAQRGSFSNSKSSASSAAAKNKEPEPKVLEAKEALSAKATVAECQQNDMLNRLLLQLLVSSVTVTTTQNPLVANLNRILNPGANSVPSSPVQQQTQIVTTTAVSTVTQLFSTVLSILFKNSKIPTTIYSSDVVVVTEVITQTLTAPAASEPTALFRRKREDVPDEDEESNPVQPSIRHDDRSDAVLIRPTEPLANDSRSSSVLHHRVDESIDQQRLTKALSHPKVREAWYNLLMELENVV